MKSHPRETELALLASGDCGAMENWLLRRHVRACGECRRTLESFAEQRDAMGSEVIPSEFSAEQWTRLAREMRANIRLGLEAGECVRQPWKLKVFSGHQVLRPALAMACLLLLAGAGFFLREARILPVATAVVPVLASSDAGIEYRSGDTSLMLLNRNGAAVDQTVSAQGEIRSRYIDGDTGAVTINNVYLQ